jgi:hypothetical protein
MCGDNSIPNGAGWLNGNVNNTFKPTEIFFEN